MHTLVTKPTLLTRFSVKHQLKNVSLRRDVKTAQEHYTDSGCKLERGRRQRNSHRWTSPSDTSASHTEYHVSTVPQQSVQARTKEWSTGWRRTLWHAFISSFQQEQHLRSDAPTTSPRDLTLKMAAHQTSSSEKGTRPRGGWCLDSW